MKGYRVERKVKLDFIKHGWKVVRAGGSLGEYDLIAFKAGRCIFMQIKSTRKGRFYYYGYMDSKYAGFPFKLVVDFGRGSVRILNPSHTVSPSDGEDLQKYLETHS